jgi:hypothetical protein
MREWLKLYREAHREIHREIAEGRFFFSARTFGSNRLLGIAEAIGLLSRSYLRNALKFDLVPEVVLSRVLFGYDVASVARATRVYDPKSPFLGYGNRADVEKYLRAIFSYIEISSRLNRAGFVEQSHIVRTLCQSKVTSDTASLYVISNREPVNNDHDSIEWISKRLEWRLQVEHGLRLLMDVERELSKIQFDTNGQVQEGSHANAVYEASEANLRGSFDQSKVDDIFRRWMNQHEESLKGWSQELLLFSFLELLDSDDYAFVVIPKSDREEVSYYGWAGMWLLVKLPKNLELTPSLLGKFYSLCLITDHVLSEVQGYTDRLIAAQQKKLAEQRDLYESLFVTEVLPRILEGPLDEALAPLDSSRGEESVRDLFPQIPFSIASSGLVLERIEQFMVSQSASLSARQERALRSLLHDLQSDKIKRIVSLSEEEAYRSYTRLISRAVSVFGGFGAVDTRAASFRNNREEHLNRLRGTVEKLIDVREYIRCVVREFIESGKENYPGLSHRFSYKLCRSDVSNWSWNVVGRRYAAGEGISRLPFPGHYLGSVIEALLHNFQKYSAPDKNGACELLFREYTDRFEMEWRVRSAPPPFFDYGNFAKELMASVRRDGIHRGTPLSVMFALETGVATMGVWINRDRGNESNWIPLIGDLRRISRPVEWNYALYWQWQLPALVR